MRFRFLPRWHVALPALLVAAWGALLPWVAGGLGPLALAPAAKGAAGGALLLGLLVGMTARPGAPGAVRALRWLALLGGVAAVLLACGLAWRQRASMAGAAAWGLSGWGLVLLVGVALLPHGADSRTEAESSTTPGTATLRQLLVEPWVAAILGGAAVFSGYLLGYVERVRAGLALDGQLAASSAPDLHVSLPPWHVGVATGVVAGTLVAAGLAVAVFLVWRTVVPTRRELDRLRRAVDGLVKADGLARPLTVAGNDELAALGRALEQLRAHVGPALVEYQQAAAKAQAADRERTAFLGIVSSALRRPLEEIVAGAQTLLDAEAETLSAEQREDIRIIVTSSRHLTDLIDEVLDISVIASGQVHLKLASFDLSQLITEVGKAQRPLVQRKNVELKLSVPPHIEVRADERRLRQVLTNLCSNATKFTESGFIEVGATVSGTNVDVFVRDTGPGIAEEAINRLFTAFVQLGTLKQRAYGTGLGLAICKRLVEAHNGTISAESRLGEGSLFRFRIPLMGPEISLPGVVIEGVPAASNAPATQKEARG